MIQLNIKALCKLRNIAHPLPVFMKAGISRTVAYDYMTDNRRFISLKHVEILCRIFNCTPNDLMAWQPDNAVDDVPGNALQKIKKRELPDTLTIIRSKSIEEIIQWTDNEKKV